MSIEAYLSEQQKGSGRKLGNPPLAQVGGSIGVTLSSTPPYDSTTGVPGDQFLLEDEPYNDEGLSSEVFSGKVSASAKTFSLGDAATTDMDVSSLNMLTMDPAELLGAAVSGQFGWDGAADFGFF